MKKILFVLFVLMLLTVNCGAFMAQFGTKKEEIAKWIPLALASLGIGGAGSANKIIIVKNTESLNKGESFDVSVSLSKTPSSETKVTVTNSESSLLVNNLKTTTLIFTSQNYSTPQKLLFSAPLDDKLDNVTVQVEIKADGYPTENFPILIKSGNTLISLLKTNRLES
jgi:hypothetical protein